jgi:hypothetical protein
VSGLITYGNNILKPQLIRIHDQIRNIGSEDQFIKLTKQMKEHSIEIAR